MSSAVTVNNVFKRYGRVEALQGVSLSVDRKSTRLNSSH